MSAEGRFDAVEQAVSASHDGEAAVTLRVRQAEESGEVCVDIDQFMVRAHEPGDVFLRINGQVFKAAVPVRPDATCIATSLAEQLRESGFAASVKRGVRGIHQSHAHLLIAM